MSTLLYYTPIYDKNGKNLNPDANTISWSVHCRICKKNWSAASRLGDTLFKEVKE